MLIPISPELVLFPDVEFRTSLGTSDLLATIIRNSFIHKNRNCRFLVLGREGPFFVKEHSDLKNKYNEENMINKLEFLVDNNFVVLWDRFSNSVPLS